jgi:hypothetical protein
MVCGSQVPWALQVAVCSPSAAQLAGPQAAPAGSRWQPPLPSQPLLQASSLHAPLGSAPLGGTGVQVPAEPGKAHDWHTPSHFVMQQRPWAQIPGAAHSSLRAQAAPIGRLPHDPAVHWLPAAHWSLVVQKDPQRTPESWQRNGAQGWAAGVVQVPALQTPAAVATLAMESHEACPQTVPSG